MRLTGGRGGRGKDASYLKLELINNRSLGFVVFFFFSGEVFGEKGNGFDYIIIVIGDDD